MALREAGPELLSSTPKKAQRKLFKDLSESPTSHETGDSRRGTKHELTPNSKSANQPSSKRFLVGM